MDLAERIRNLRLDRGEDQYEVAAAAGVSRVTVTQWEGGKKKPSRRSLAAVARHFNVSMDFLLFGAEQRSNVTLESRDEERMILLLRRAPGHVRDAVRTLLENTAEAQTLDPDSRN
jgi:transcriptional regulator with XRE-family HTH domain